MRLLAAVISAQVLASAACAETLPEKIVGLLKDVCVAPLTAEAMMAAGEKFAAAGNWKLMGSGPAPLPMMHNENGPKISFTSGWEVDFPEGVRLNVFLSIVRPEMPGVKHSICMIEPSVDFDGDALANSVEQIIGSDLTKDTSRRFREQDAWFFTPEKNRGNCGKSITVTHYLSHSRGKPKTLMFRDLAYPQDWGASAYTRCQS
jgi:hypothetical protein